MFEHVVIKLGILQNLHIYEYDFYENNNDLIKAFLEYKETQCEKNVTFYFKFYAESVSLNQREFLKKKYLK